MVIGRCGTISDDGVTIVYDANTEAMYELRIPHLPNGTEIRKDRKGNWHPVTTGLAKETKNRIEQADKFYYQTRDILRYADYLYVYQRFPTNCAIKFEENPFFLADIIHLLFEFKISVTLSIFNCAVELKENSFIFLSKINTYFLLGDISNVYSSFAKTGIV